MNPLVSPVRKKPGNDNSFQNIRPVRNLQFVLKLTKRAVFYQIHSHMEQLSSYPLLQSAYRKFHRTETALLKVHNDILSNMDQRVELLVLLDLSAAFDTVDHEVLFRGMESSYGNLAMLYNGRSYLEGRSQCSIFINGSYSDTLDLRFGVPQVSCLGFLLLQCTPATFLKWKKKNHFPEVHANVDDTWLYLSFSPDSPTSQVDAIYAAQNCFKDIRTWMTVDKIKLKGEKTEFIALGIRATTEQRI